MLASVAERLSWKIDKSSGPDACWLWTGGKRGRDGAKYGSMYAGGENRLVHALVLELHTNELANGRHALHSCDNPVCCNPAHLRWGTHQDNMRDRNSRNRQARLAGEKHGDVKLTSEQIATIRQRHVARDLQNSASALAREFGVHTSTIHLIVHKKLWRHIQ